MHIILPRRQTAREDCPVLSVVSAVTDGVDESGLAFFDLLDGALERRLEVVAAFERSLRIPAHRFRQAGEIGIGTKEIHADMRAVGVGAASSGQDELMIPVIIVRAIVEHHDEHRDLILGCDPERAGVEHEIAVGLQIDDEASRTFIGKGGAK